MRASRQCASQPEALLAGVFCRLLLGGSSTCRFEAKTATFRMNAELLRLRQSVTVADLQSLGGLAAVSTEAFEGALDHDPPLFLQVERVIAAVRVASV